LQQHGLVCLLHVQVFPYELREHATYLGHDAYHDELDALALLLASPHSKQRFQRYFEQYADVITSASSPAAAAGGASGATSRHSSADAAASGARRFRLGLPLLTAADEDAAAPAVGQQQQQQQRQQQELPVVRRRSLQQQQAQAAAAGPVAYVSPAAPGRLLAAAQPDGPHPPAAATARLAQPPQQQQQQQQQPQQDGNDADNYFNAMLTAVGMTADEIAVLRASAAAAAGPGLAALAPAAAAGGAAVRLSGRRRTWLEACEPDAQPAAAAATAGTAAAARAQGRQAAAAAAGGSATAISAVNNSGVWRAVHEALTSDDEGLLQCVARLVPYSFAGQLRDTGETAAQLQALAGSRPVPPKVSVWCDGFWRRCVVRAVECCSDTSVVAGTGRQLCRAAQAEVCGCCQELCCQAGAVQLCRTAAGCCRDDSTAAGAVKQQASATKGEGATLLVGAVHMLRDVVMEARL
jgi:hypothetical protein